MLKNKRYLVGGTILAFCTVLAVSMLLVNPPKAYAPGDSCIAVTKWCTSATVPGGPIIFGGTVSNCNYYWWLYDVIVVDDKTGQVVGPIDIAPNGSVDFSGSYDPDNCGTMTMNTVVATGQGQDGYTRTATAYAICETPCDGGGDGCTPGYWKNHLDMWPATGLSPLDDFDATFGVDYYDPDITLDMAINMGGGGVKKLTRHGTAALLSALHPAVNYPYTAVQVIAAVQAGDADTLAEYNELGCPID